MNGLYRVWVGDRAQFGSGILPQIVFFTGVLGFWMLGFGRVAGGIFGIEGGVGGCGGTGASMVRQECPSCLHLVT